MIPRGSRLTLWFIALLLSAKLSFTGRAPTDPGGDAAFLRPGAGIVTVRLAGGFPSPGVYRFPDAAAALSAIKMTLPGGALPAVRGTPGGRPLVSGDVVTLVRSGREKAYFSLGSMGVKERMLLGIPLHPDLLGVEEWCALPGIGPVLSGRIVAERQENGAFGTLAGLLRVPGIGPGKVAAIRRYF